MPTEFTKCSECSYVRGLGLNDSINKNFKRDLDKFQALIEGGMDEEKALNKIIKNNKVVPCSYCHTYTKNVALLCEKHVERYKIHALENGLSGGICDQCSSILESQRQRY
jgi:hypothetical protein